jgi:metal-responsive CopG/Arc/MetJ family transcriptional regulator
MCLARTPDGKKFTVEEQLREAIPELEKFYKENQEYMKRCEMVEEVYREILKKRRKKKQP